jgi:hypothetical protein
MPSSHLRTQKPRRGCGTIWPGSIPLPVAQVGQRSSMITSAGRLRTSIPPDLRGNLGPVLDAAKSRGLKVDPRFYVAAASTHPSPKKGVAAALSALNR